MGRPPTRRAQKVPGRDLRVAALHYRRDVRRHRRVRADAVLLHEAEQVCLGEVPRVPG